MANAILHVMLSIFLQIHVPVICQNEIEQCQKWDININISTLERSTISICYLISYKTQTEEVRSNQKSYVR